MREKGRENDGVGALVVNFCFKDKAAQVGDSEALASRIPISF